MTAAGAHHRPVGGPSRLFAWGSFAIMVGGWIAFLAALIGSQQALDDVWAAVRDRPLLVEGLVWLLAFPLLVGLAIWQASWHEAVRLTAVALLAAAYMFMFVPRGPKR